MTPDEIKSLRTRLGLTQKELADRLGLRQATVSRWESGSITPGGAAVTLLRLLGEQ